MVVILDKAEKKNPQDKNNMTKILIGINYIQISFLVMLI